MTAHTDPLAEDFRAGRTPAPPSKCCQFFPTASQITLPKYPHWGTKSVLCKYSAEILVKVQRVQSTWRIKRILRPVHLYSTDTFSTSDLRCMVAFLKNRFVICPARCFTTGVPPGLPSISSGWRHEAKSLLQAGFRLGRATDCRHPRLLPPNGCRT